MTAAQHYAQLARLLVLRAGDTDGAEPRVPAAALAHREEWRVEREVAALSRIAQADSRESLPDLIERCLKTPAEIVSLEEEEFTLLHGLGAGDLEDNPFRPFNSAIFTPMEAKNPNSQQSTQQRFDQLLAELRLRRGAVAGPWQPALLRAWRQLEQLLFLCRHAFRRLIVDLAGLPEGGRGDPQAALAAADPYLFLCDRIATSRQRWMAWTQTQSSPLPLDRFQKALQTLAKIQQYRRKFNAQRLFHIQNVLAQRQAGPAAPPSVATAVPQATPLPPAASPAPPTATQLSSTAAVAPSPSSSSSVYSDAVASPGSGAAPQPRPSGSRGGPATPPTAVHPIDGPPAGPAPAPSGDRLFRGRRRLAAVRLQRFLRRCWYWRRAQRRWRASSRPNTAEVAAYRKQLAGRVAAAQASRAALQATGHAHAWAAAVLLQRAWRRVAARNLCSLMLWAVLTLQRFLRGYYVRRYRTHWVRAFHTLRVYRRQRANLAAALAVGRQTAPAMAELLQWQLNLSAELRRTEAESQREAKAFEASWKSWEKQLLR
eukprot:EG_transcript_8801